MSLRNCFSIEHFQPTSGNTWEAWFDLTDNTIQRIEINGENVTRHIKGKRREKVWNWFYKNKDMAEAAYYQENPDHAL